MMGSDSKFSPVDYNHTPDEMLQHLVEQGIINLSDVDKSMKQKELDKVLQNHPYSIYKDNRGRFCTYVADENSPRKVRAIAKSTEEKLNIALYEHYTGLSDKQRAKRITLAELYLEWSEFKAVHVKSSTMTRVISDWKKYYEGTDIVSIPICKLTPVMLDKWIHELIQRYDMKKTNFYNVRSIIVQELDYAVGIGIIDVNPMSSVKVDVKRRLRKDKKPSSDKKVFITDEVDAITRLAWTEFENSTRKSVLAPLAVIFLLYTGLRISEVCAIRYEDLIGSEYIYIQRMLERDSKQVVDHTKGNANDRLVPLVSKAQNIIEAARKRQQELGVSTEGYIFTITDNPVPYYAVSDLFRKYCKKLDIPPRSVHATRRTFISTLIDANININTIREIVGHSSEMTTLKNYCFDRSRESERLEKIENAFK